MARRLGRIWSNETGQDIAEYAVMLVLIVALVVGTVRVLGGRANHVLSSVAEVLQHSEGEGD